MCAAVNEIFRILQECHFEKEGYQGIVRNEKNSLENVKKEIEELLASARSNIGSIEYANLNKMLAICYLKIGNELQAVCHLIESHAVILRQQILHRYIKTEMREGILDAPQTYGLKSSYIDFKANNKDNIDAIKTRLSELPQEWYMVQITVQHETPSNPKCKKSTFSEMHPVHITILPTGRNRGEPICITLPKPELYNSYDICNEIQMLLFKNRSDLEAHYANNKSYWKMREKQNTTMKTAVHELEYTWFREWRILFMADLLNSHELEIDLLDMIDKLISDYKAPYNVSKRSEWLLKKIALGACFLTRDEIARAVNYVLPNHDKLAGNIILSLYGKLSCIKELQSATRKTLVLIVDEHMDYIPFESIEILKSHPTTRFPSLHIAYALFKEHESTIENGCKLIKVRDDMGTCIVNPSGNLSKMEKRMRLFIQYWLPHWQSWYNVEPKEELFEDALINRDILMYLSSLRYSFFLSL